MIQLSVHHNLAHEKVAQMLAHAHFLLRTHQLQGDNVYLRLLHPNQCQISLE